MKLHILTACTRPANLPRVGESIIAATPRGWDVSWHVRFDPQRIHVGGQALKNQMLDEITDGWCWILDDDTVAHPDILYRLSEVLVDKPKMRALVVDQTRADGRYLIAAPDQVAIGYIDAGQAIIRRDLIADKRLPENYEGDGHWLMSVLRDQPYVVYLNLPLSLHNALCGQ